ncbi:phosphomannomutase [Ponticoccus gilvus]|nr:phosphomannomutase [Enemella evansiae]
MAPKFGTSGLRGLVTELTPDLITDYTRAFLTVCPHGGGLWLGRDLRESSPEIAAMVAEAASASGISVFDCGALPTPTLALAAQVHSQAAVMVTGSHIPADRNGLKFYTAAGEITKSDEMAILAMLGTKTDLTLITGKIATDPQAVPAYIARYVQGFGTSALAGLRIGIWEHSSVARDILAEILTACGAEIVRLGRSEQFVPVDTEAVDTATRFQLAGWATAHQLDALVSTDGDADRPMLSDANGQIIPGDILGPLTAAILDAQVVVTPVSSNTAIDLVGRYQVIRTKIGSPYVIAEIAAALAKNPADRVVGYEANGGFLLGFDAQGPAGPLPALITRDSLLPILAPLAAARAAKLSLAELVTNLPPRFTAADRMQAVEPDTAQRVLAQLRAAPAGLLTTAGMEPEADRDETDGLRLIDWGGTVLHLRPSGNAPEFRVYVEANSSDRAETVLAAALDALQECMSNGIEKGLHL